MPFFDLLFEIIDSIQFRHRLQIYQLVNPVTEVTICNEKIVIIFLYSNALVREFKKPFPSCENLVGIVCKRRDGRFKIAWLRISRSYLYQLSARYFVKYLSVDLEHRANLAGYEELKARNGEHVDLCRATVWDFSPVWG